MEEDKDAIIDRLIQEARNTREQAEKVLRVLSKDARFTGLSLVGGVSALMKAFQDTEDELRELNDSIDAESRKALKRYTGR